MPKPGPFLRRNYPDSYNGILVAKQDGSTRGLVRPRSISTTYQFPNLNSKICHIKSLEETGADDWEIIDRVLSLTSYRYELNIQVGFPSTFPTDGEAHSLEIRNWTHVKDRSQPALYGESVVAGSWLYIRDSVDYSSEEFSLRAPYFGSSAHRPLKLFMPSLGTDYGSIVQPEELIAGTTIDAHTYITANAQPGKWLLFGRLLYNVRESTRSWVAFWINSTEAKRTPDHLEFKFDEHVIYGAQAFYPRLNADADTAEKKAVIQSVKGIFSGESIRIEPMYPES